MKTRSFLSVLFIAGLSVISAATVNYELNSLETRNEHRKNDFQTTISTNIESTTGKSLKESLQSAQLRHNVENMDKSNINGNQAAQVSAHLFLSQDLPPARSQVLQGSGIKTEQSLFKSNRLVPASSIAPEPSDLESYSEQLNLPHQEQLYSRAQDVPHQENFYGGGQEISDQQRFYHDSQETPDHRRHFGDQDSIPAQRDRFGNPPDTREQFYGSEQRIPEERRFYNDMQPEVNQQQFFRAGQPAGQHQQFYSNIEVGMNDQRINSGKSLQTVSQLKDQTYSGKQLVSVQSKGIQGNVRLSAFDTRKQPLILPQNTALHSSSFIVSGMSSLPMLPAMVYNSGPIPSTHALAVSKGTAYPIGASIRQHLQTPYVRYVYSHLL